MKYLVYANNALVDKIEEKEGYTAKDYRDDCSINGWEFAPCTEDSYIELVPVPAE